MACRAAGTAAAAASSFVPCYLVERVTNYYHLTHQQLTYFTWSGWRIELLIIIVLSSSLVWGATLRDFIQAATGSVIGVSGFLVMVYALCDPRLCYSAGPDGLEPLRLGFFLSCVAICGSYLGSYARMRKVHSLPVRAVMLFAAFVSVGYFPIAFTQGGVMLLFPFHPIAVAIFLFLLAFSLGPFAASNLGFAKGAVLILSAAATTIMLTVGLAIPFLTADAEPLLSISAAPAAGVAAGTFLLARKGRTSGLFLAQGTKLIGLCLLLLLAMTVIFVPAGIVGLSPGGGLGKPTFDSPSYVGGFMDDQLGSTEGVALNVSFAGTQPSSIQNGNFLAAGIGIHSAGCCVDGIDYGYRFDVYLMPGGNESLVASAWEACDYNAACGGHSWKVLLFSNSTLLAHSNVDSSVLLELRWVGHTVLWSYYDGGSGWANFSRYSPPPAENPAFNLGWQPGGGYSFAETGYYFFQFGISSRYPIGHGGWSVKLTCPSFQTESGWECVPHARVLQGNDSFWKVLWRWGNFYPEVSVRGSPGNHAASFSYSAGATAQSSSRLW